MTNDMILLVEDNPDDVTFAIRAFKKNNFAHEIVVASDGAEALDLLFHGRNGSPLEPILMLLDLNLPKLSGIEVLRRIRSDPKYQSLPVVILTTSNEDRDIIDSYHFGANSYVNKPVDFQDFVRATGILGLYWLTLNQTPSTRSRSSREG
jgi:two-component system response regulator